MWTSASNRLDDEHESSCDNQASTSSGDVNFRLSLDSGISSFSRDDSSFDVTLDNLDTSDSLLNCSQQSCSFVSPPIRYPSEDSGDNEQSPPTKWPRATTPPTRRKFSFSADKEETVPSGNMSFSSPPLVKAMNPLSTVGMRTPKTSIQLRSSVLSTPSPFRLSRLSAFSSPTLTSGALQLSNSEKHNDYCFYGDSLTKKDERLASNNGSNVNRCLLAPLNSSASKQYYSNENKSAIKSTVVAPETPSKSLFLDEDSAFIGFDAISSTPLKSLNCLGDDEDFENTFVTSQKCPARTQRWSRSVGEFLLPRNCRPSSPHQTFPNNPALENVKSDAVVTSRFLDASCTIPASSPPRRSLFDSSENDSLLALLTLYCRRPNILKRDHRMGLHLLNKLQMLVDENSTRQNKRKRGDKEVIGDQIEPFITPKKNLKLYSTKWLLIATGQTKEQKELTAAAYSYLGLTPESKNISTTFRQKMRRMNAEIRRDATVTYTKI